MSWLLYTGAIVIDMSEIAELRIVSNIHKVPYHHQDHNTKYIPSTSQNVIFISPSLSNPQPIKYCQTVSHNESAYSMNAKIHVQKHARILFKWLKSTLLGNSMDNPSVN